MAINLDDYFVTIEVLDRHTGNVVYSQEIPSAVIGRFAVTIGHSLSKTGDYLLRIMKGHTELSTF